MNPKAYRLPMSVLPRQYDIALNVRLGSTAFHGHVTIQLEIATSTNAIALHARALNITNAQLTLQTHTLSAAVTLDPEREIALLAFAETLPTGSAALDLTYTGSVSTTLEGLFVSKDGADELLCTQCEVTGARAILPCFDEPIFKARFTWRITTAPRAIVLTNAPLVAGAPSADGDGVTWTFAPTKPISSYLLALIIGNIASTPERIVNGVPLRIWALAGKENLGLFAQDYTARLLPFYEDYFALPYHFDKLDQIGVPSFGVGAMENVGLIISQQTTLLLDPRLTSRRREAMAATLIAHEFAHMWFGNLVTMKWWDDLWLNEAFATWMAYYAVDALSPEYRVWDEAQLGVDQALDDDALARTHPIYYAVETPHSILENFDNIIYFKGAAVVRMIHNFLGDSAFRAGLRAYMREFAGGNSTGEDLWRHLKEAAHQPIGPLMESWILQAGHPLLDVALDDVEGTTVLRLTQRCFLLGGQTDTSGRIWQIPVIVRYEDSAGAHQARYLLDEREASFPLSVQGHFDWLYANANEVGFYRQRLDAPVLRQLLGHLDRLTPAEQKGLLRDQWALVTIGAQSVAAYLDVLVQLAGSDDQSLVSQIVGKHLATIERLLEIAGDEQALKQFRVWVDRLFRERMAALGIEPHVGETPEQAQLRAQVMTAMTHFARDATIIEQARTGQAREAIAPNSVDADLAPVFVVATAESGDEGVYDHYLEIYRSRQIGDFTPEQVQRYAAVFGRFQQPQLATRTIALLTEGVFSFRAMAQNLQTMLTQPRTQAQAWEYIKAQWPVLRDKAPLMAPFFVQFTGNLPSTFRGDVATFWESNLHGEHAEPLARALEQINQNAAIEALTREGLLAYFHSAKGAHATDEDIRANSSKREGAELGAKENIADNSGARTSPAPSASGDAMSSEPGIENGSDPRARPRITAEPLPLKATQTASCSRTRMRGFFVWLRRIISVGW